MWDRDGDGKCTDQCPAGTWYMQGSNVENCTECAPGQYDHDNYAGNQCYVCPEGQYTPGGLVSCADCPRGQYDADRDSATECARCPLGTYTPGTTTPCTECMAGQADGDEDSGTPCTGCPSGRFSINGSHGACGLRCPATFQMPARWNQSNQISIALSASSSACDCSPYILTIQNHNGEALEANLSAQQLVHNSSVPPEAVVLHVSEGTVRQRVCLMAGTHSLEFKSNASMSGTAPPPGTSQCRDRPGTDLGAASDIEAMTGWVICDDGTNNTVARDSGFACAVVAESAAHDTDDFTAHRALSTPAVHTRVDLTGRTDSLQGGECSLEWGAGERTSSLSTYRTCTKRIYCFCKCTANWLVDYSWVEPESTAAVAQFDLEEGSSRSLNLQFALPQVRTLQF